METFLDSICAIPGMYDDGAVQLRKYKDKLKLSLNSEDWGMAASIMDDISKVVYNDYCPDLGDLSVQMFVDYGKAVFIIKLQNN